MRQGGLCGGQEVTKELPGSSFDFFSGGKAKLRRGKAKLRKGIRALGLKHQQRQISATCVHCGFSAPIQHSGSSSYF